MSSNLTFNISADTKQAEAALVSLARSFQQLQSTASGVGAGAGGIASIGGAATAALGPLAAIKAAVVAVTAAAGAMGFALKKGLDVNAESESTALGLKALIASLFEVRNASGQAVKGQEALAISGEEAQRQLNLLRVAGMNTAAEFKDLAAAFQTALGAGAGAGLSVDQIRELTVSLTQAAGAFNLSGDQLSSEIRAVLSGDEIDNSQIAKGLALTGAQIKQLREQGTLYEELNKRLENFRLVGDEAGQTWSATLSNLNDGISKFLGNASKGAFADIKKSLQDAFTATIDVKTGEVSDELSGLETVAASVFGAMGELASDAIRGAVELAKELSDWFEQNKVQVYQTVDAVMAVIGAIARAIGAVVQFVARLVGATVQTGTLSSALNQVVLIIAVIDDAFKLVIGTLGVIGSVIVAVVLEPLKSVMSFIDKLLGSDFAGVTERAQEAAIEFGKTAKEYAAAGIRREATAAAEADIAARARTTFGLTDPRRVDGGGVVDNSKLGGSSGGKVGAGRKTTDDKAKEAAKKALDDLNRSLEQLQKARDDAADREFDAKQQRLRAELDKEVALGKKSKQEEIDARLALEQGAIDRERQLVTARLADLKGKQAAAKTDIEKNGIQAQIVKAEGDLKVLEEKQRTITIKAEIDTKAAERAAQDLVDEITGNLKDLGGNLDVALDRVEQKRKKLLADERVRNNANLQKLVNEQAAAERLKASYDIASEKFKRGQTDLSIALTDIEQRYQAGAINSLEYEDQLRQAREKSLDVMQQQVDAMLALAKATNNVNLLQQAQQAKQALNAVKNDINQANRESALYLRDQLSGALIDATKASESFAVALRDNIRRALASAVEKQATKFLNAFLDDIFESINKSLAESATGGGGWGTLLNGIGGMFGLGSGTTGVSNAFSAGWSWLTSAFGFAEGGHITGPGTGTSDSIPIRASNGEFMVRASAVRSLGVPVLDYINRTGRLPPAFNAGGLIETGGGVGPTTVDNQVNVSPKVVVTSRDILDGVRGDPDFQRFIVQTVIDNRRRINS